MSKENALVELWRILNDKEKPKDKTLFEWRHHHLRAVWRAGVAKDGKTPLASAPENIIFVYSQDADAKKKTPKMEVAYALVDVIQGTTTTTVTLRVHALMTRPPGGVWKFNSAKMIALEDKSFLLDLVDILLPPDVIDVSQDDESIISEVYQRGDAENYNNFMEKVWEAWKNETVSFFTKKTHTKREAVSVYAENLSMGIKLKGLGFVRNPGPSTIFKTPVSWAKTLALEEIKFPGIHYAGLGIGDIKDKAKWRAPLGMMFLDTLFLDSFSMTPHKLKKKSNPKPDTWPTEGALVEFFEHPSKDVISYTHAAERPVSKGRIEVTVANVTSYSIIDGRGLIMKIPSEEYSPLTGISFLFKENKADDLRRADDGHLLMDILTGDFLGTQENAGHFKGMTSGLFPEEVALRFFGDKDFFIETDAEKQKKLKAEEKKKQKLEAEKKKQQKKLEKAEEKKQAAILIYKTAVAQIQNLITAEKTELEDIQGVENLNEAFKEFIANLDREIKKIPFEKLWNTALKAGATGNDLKPTQLDIYRAGFLELQKIVSDKILAEEKTKKGDQTKNKKEAIKAYKDAVAGFRRSITDHENDLKAIQIVDTLREALDEIKKNLSKEAKTFRLAEKYKIAKGTKASTKDLGPSVVNVVLDALADLTKIAEDQATKIRTKAIKAYTDATNTLRNLINKLKRDLRKLPYGPKLTKSAKNFEQQIVKELNKVNTLKQAAITAGALIHKLGAQEVKLAANGVADLKKIVAAKTPKGDDDEEEEEEEEETRRAITYGSAKPAAATLYMLGSPGRIDAKRIREDPIYTGAGDEPEVSNLSNFSLEFYGSKGAALASSLSMGASIRAKGLIPKAVTVDGGRLEQTSFNYYYGAYWVDEYTGFETSGEAGNVTSFPGNYITIPERGAILYHIGATTIGSVSYDFATMAEQVSLDNPDFEIMLQSPVVGEAAPGSSRLSNSGAIILGLRLPEGGSGAYSVRSIAYAPRVVKM